MYGKVTISLPDGTKPDGAEAVEKFALTMMNKLATNGVHFGQTAFALREAIADAWPGQKANAHVESV